MKRTIFVMSFVCMFIFTSIYSASAFEIYGYWKSDLKYPLNIIKFDKSTYYYGKYSQPAKYSKENNITVVQFTKYSKLHILEEQDDIIKITFPDPSLPKHIIYKRISEEEAVKLIGNN